ncbi:MAG: alpha/beta hydrolase-fold protein [Collinsella sp.]|nr:alpha/beta hydrolase-fold protein [Collinsella sp.]
MAQISIDYFSSSLMRTTTIDMILPFDGMGDALASDAALRQDERAWDRAPYPPEKPPFKTLYLLHGITGNHTDWISESRICTWATERNLAVVMPSGYNAFYLDQPETHNYYGRFVGQELVSVTRRILPLSTRREDTFIGGISMGAYGALRAGLRYCETFGSIISLSSAMVADSVESVITDDIFFLSRPFLESTFGDLSQLVGSQKDPARLAADLVYCDRPRPRVFMACGSSDPLAHPNRVLAERLRSVGLEVDHRELSGGHDWEFWNSVLPQALDWLPR